MEPIIFRERFVGWKDDNMDTKASKEKKSPVKLREIDSEVRRLISGGVGSLRDYHDNSYDFLGTRIDPTGDYTRGLKVVYHSRFK